MRAWGLEAMRERAEMELRVVTGAGRPASLAARASLNNALRLAEKLQPRIAAGTRDRVDAGKDIAALRLERLKAVGR